MWHLILSNRLSVVAEPELLCLAEVSTKAGSHTLDTYGVCLCMVAVKLSVCNSVRMKKVVLASVSPWRKKIFSTAGIPFSVEESGYEENMKLQLAPRALARRLALGKAQAVAARLRKRAQQENTLVIGADTFAVFKGKLLGKPRTSAQATRMLKMLSGRTHVLLTGIAIVDSKTGRHITKTVGTRVTFRRLSARDIARYVKTGESLTVAGGYAIQGGAAGFVEHIVGDYNNIVGLPLAPLIEALRRFGIG